MSLQSLRTGKALIVRLAGEFDLHAAHPFKEAVADALALDPGLTHLVIQMQQVTFMDSSGVGAILARYRDVKARGGVLAVVGLQPAVRKVFDLSGMGRVIPVYATEGEALAHL